jgi:hypothetical protein
VHQEGANVDPYYDEIPSLDDHEPVDEYVGSLHHHSKSSIRR